MRTLFYLLIISLFLSCVPSRLSTGNSTPAVPLSYTGGQDSMNLSDFSWKKFFDDTLLRSLISRGIASNPDRLIYGFSMAEAFAESNLARRSLYPRGDLTTAFTQRKFGLYTMDGAGNISTDILPGRIVPIHLPDYYIGVQSSWEVDVWKKLRNKRKAALNRMLQQAEMQKFFQTQLVAGLALNYAELVSLDQTLELVRKSIVLRENALELMKIQMEAGELNDLAVKRFESQVITSKAMEISIGNSITELELLTSALTGTYGTSVSRSREFWSDPNRLDPWSGVPGDLLKNRPDVIAAGHELHATEADLAAARAAYFPALGISAALGLQAFMPAYLFTLPASLAYSFMGHLTAPLFNRARLNRDYQVSTARQGRAQLNYRKVVLNAYTEVCVQLNKLRDLKKIYALKKQQVALLNSSIEITMDLFRARRANYIEVLMVQQSLLDNELDLIDVQRRINSAYINLYKVLGGGWK